MTDPTYNLLDMLNAAFVGGCLGFAIACYAMQRLLMKEYERAHHRIRLYMEKSYQDGRAVGSLEAYSRGYLAALQFVKDQSACVHCSGEQGGSYED